MGYLGECAIYLSTKKGSIQFSFKIRDKYPDDIKTLINNNFLLNELESILQYNFVSEKIILVLNSTTGML